MVNKIYIDDGNETITINDYRDIENGTIIEDKNGTIIKVKERKLIGSHNISQLKWKEYNGESKTKKGIYYIKIEGKKEIRDNIEWVSTIRVLDTDIRLQEFATWNSSFENNLQAWWKLNETSGLTAYDSIGRNNLTWADLWNATGLKYYSFRPNQTGYYTSNINQNNFTAITLNFWLMTGEIVGGPGDCHIMGTGSAPDSGEWYIDTVTANTFYVIYMVTPGNQKDTPYAFNAGAQSKWTMFSVRLNSSTLQVFLNGTLFDEDTAGGVGSFANKNITFWGYDNGAKNCFGNIYDEIGIWSRWVTDSELTDLYNNGTGLTYGQYVPPDTIAPETSIPNITPIQPKTTDNLQCNATLTDDKQTNLTANWTWYKNDILNLSGTKTGIENGTYTLITTLNSANTIKGEQWICEVLPFDGINYGNASNSSSVTILNTIPNQFQPLLTTASGKNLSTEDLTCLNQSTFDADNDAVVNIYNWFKNSQPFAVLNMPFEGGSNESYTKDYSGKGKNGNVTGATWSSTAGKIAGGYEFDRIDDWINAGNVLSGTNTPFTAMAWVRVAETLTSWKTVFGEGCNGFDLAINLGTIKFGRNCGGTYGVFYTGPPISSDTWYHLVIVYNGSNIDLYKDAVKTIGGTVSYTHTNTNLCIGSYNCAAELFNGSIDEVRIYPYALTPEQIQAHYNLEYNKIVSQETTAGDKYMCQVTPNDAEADGLTLNSSTLNINWKIIFNVTSGEDGSQISNFNINCNNSFSASGVNSPYEAGFLPGSYECIFEKYSFFDKTKIFIANTDKTIDVVMSKSAYLTIEEHTWLEWLYNCFKNGECRALLENINKTTTQIWQRLTGTDTSVITQEKVLSYELSDSSNISINYTIKVPYKEGVAINELLPIRLYFWFTDPTRTKCYSQDKATDTNRAEAPYCLPLVAETLGPNNGTLTFTVDLRPALASGTYNFTRSIEIDPLGVWTQYGREDLGTIEVADSGDANIGVSNENRINFKASEDTLNKQAISQDTETTQSNKPGITGAVIGTNISGWQMVAVTAIIAGLFLALIICQTIIRLKSLKIKKNKK